MRYSFFAAAMMAILAVSLTGKDALAQACNQTGYTYNASCQGNVTKSSGSVSGSATTVAAAQATTGLVMSRVNRITAGDTGNLTVGSTTELLSLGRGDSAGGAGENRAGIWVNGAFIRADGDANDAGFESNIITGMIGADYAVNDQLIIGLGFGYENQDTDTDYNNGDTQGDGFSGTAYFSYQFDEIYSLTGTLGYTRLSYDHTRTDPLSNAKITGDNDANRYAGSLSGLASWTEGPLRYGASVGTLYILEKQDAFTESNGVAVESESISVGQVNLGGNAAYRVGVAEPFVNALVGYDYNDAGGSYDNKFSVSGALGSNFYLTEEFTLNAQAIGQYRNDLTVYGGSATARYSIKW
jgi:hypothetical protein